MTGADRAQLRQVRAAILGNRPDTSLSSTLYPVYVAFIIAGSYGVGASQQLFTSREAQWLAEHAWSLRGAAAAVTTAAMVLALVRLLGRVRGPVVPPLPYLQLVVASPMPRKVTLGRHWRLSLGGSTFGSLLLGLVISAGAVITNVATPSMLLPACLGGGLFGALAAESWLRGQLHGQTLDSTAGSGRGSSVGFAHGSSVLSRRRNALARLDITSLRRQSASNVTMGGAVLAGDLRMVRLDAARPTTRVRHVRLRAGGPLSVIAHRDLLGLRRAPWSALSGLALVVAGSTGLLLSLLSPRTSTLIPLFSLVLCHLGFGAWCEGLRLHADNSGTSRLLGLPYRDTALAHLAVPLLGWVLTTSIVSAALFLLHLTRPVTLVWALATGALLAGTHLMAAFRGQPPMGVFGPQAGPPAMAFWYAKPLLATLIVGTATAAWAARGATPWTALSVLLIGTAGVMAWGLGLVDKRDQRQ